MEEIYEIERHQVPPEITHFSFINGLKGFLFIGIWKIITTMAIKGEWNLIISIKFNEPSQH
jgi:hypothetical protein